MLGRTAMDRRTFLISCFISTASIAVGADWYINAFDSSPEKTKQKHSLLFKTLLPVLLDGALSTNEAERQQQIERTIENIHITMSLLPENAEQKLIQLLEMLETKFGTLLLTSSFTSYLELNPTGLQQLLTYWREHYLSMMNEAYLGLRELVMSSYYASPEHWGFLGYQKPMLGAVNQ